MSEKQCFTWSELGEEWIGAMYQWSDVCILKKVKQQGGNAGLFDAPPHTYLPPEEIKKPLTKKEYKRFVELVCTVNGITKKERKERKDKDGFKITIAEFNKTVEVVEKSVKVTKISREDI